MKGFFSAHTAAGGEETHIGNICGAGQVIGEMDFLSVPIDKILDASAEMTHSVTVVAAEPACQVHAALLRAPVTRAPVRELGDRALSGKRFSTEQKCFSVSGESALRSCEESPER